MFKPLDLLFVQDATGSQQPYIDAVRKGIDDICDCICSSPLVDTSQLRTGLIAFRDWSDKSSSFVTKDYGFTQGAIATKNNLNSLAAMGGADAAEAQAPALGAALGADWRDDAAKVVVLITDSPPHGIGESSSSDSYAGGDPDHSDPVVIVDAMAAKGITLFVVACEPTLSNYFKRAKECYQGLTMKTYGKIVPLIQIDDLAPLIIGLTLVQIDAEPLIAVHADYIANAQQSGQSIDDISSALHESLTAQNVQSQDLSYKDLYINSQREQEIAHIWYMAKSLAEGRSKSSDYTGARLSNVRSDQKVELKKQPIHKEFVTQIVSQSLARRAF